VKLNKLLQASKQRKELRRTAGQNIQRTLKRLLKDSKVILKDGYQNGKEKDIKRKVKRELEKLKVWLLSVNKKLKMFLQLMLVPVRNKSLSKQLKKESD
jgi:cell division septum initiation protein DivIVA